MAQHYQRQQILSGGTINANGPLATQVADLGRSLNPTVVVLVHVGASVSGSVVLQFGVSLDGTNYAIKHSVSNNDTTAITAAGDYLFEFHDVLEPYMQVSATSVSGSLTGVNIDILFTSTDV